MLTAAPADQDVFEDFEGITTVTGAPFEIGPLDARAQFGGNARAADVADAAFSGTHAWVVENSAADGTITFLDQPASLVEFYASAGTNPFGMTIRAYDPDGLLLGGPVTIDPGTGWMLVSFGGPVGRIEVSNGAVGDFVYVDDFGYSVGGSAAVPLLELPGISALIVALALSGWLVARARRGARARAPSA